MVNVLRQHNHLSSLTEVEKGDIGQYATNPVHSNPIPNPNLNLIKLTMKLRHFAATEALEAALMFADKNFNN